MCVIMKRRLKDVAAYCDIKPATTSRIIEKLLEGGFLTRTLPKDDRRAMCLQITDEGKTALEQWIGCCHEAEEMMLENFSEEERRQFFSFLSRAYDNLNQSKGGKIA